MCMYLEIGFFRSLPKFYIKNRLEKMYTPSGCLYSSTCSKHLWVSFWKNIAIRAHEYHHIGKSMVSYPAIHAPPPRPIIGVSLSNPHTSGTPCVHTSCPPWRRGGGGGGAMQRVQNAGSHMDYCIQVLWHMKSQRSGQVLSPREALAPRACVASVSMRVTWVLETHGTINKY